MPIINPTQLVDEFKKSGEFDRLRRELLTQFQQSDNTVSFTARVEDIARQRLLSDQKLLYMPPDGAHKELMKEMDRYPIVERAVGELQMLADPSFSSGIRNSVEKILREDRSHAPPSNMDVHEVKASTEAPSQPDGVSYEAPPQPSSIATLEISTSNVITAPDASRSQARMPGVDTSITQVSDEKNGVDAPGPVMDPRIPSHLSAKDC